MQELIRLSFKKKLYRYELRESACRRTPNSWSIMEDEEIIALLRWMEATAQLGWFIDDLERSERSRRMFGWVAAVLG